MGQITIMSNKVCRIELLKTTITSPYQSHSGPPVNLLLHYLLNPMLLAYSNLVVWGKFFFKPITTILDFCLIHSKEKVLIVHLLLFFFQFSGNFGFDDHFNLFWQHRH